MSYLFYIDDKNNTVLHRDCVNLCPELSVLTNEEVLFIVLAYDYHSPYRQFPEDDRIRKAMIHVYNDNNPKLMERDIIKSAIDAYKSLQYSPKIELAEKYQKKIDSLLLKLEADDNPTANKNILVVINAIRKDIIALESEIADEVQKDGVIKGQKELSWLEKLQRNQKYYKSVITKK
jgi:hypothetical protein